MQQRPRPISLLLVDYGDVASAGLMTLLANDRRFRVALTTAAEAIAQARRLQPHLIVVDPHYDGRLDLRIVSDLATAAPNACICLYTTNTEPRTLAGALNRGVRGYLVKGSDSRRGSGAGVLLLESLAFLGRFKTAVIDPAILDHLGAGVAATLTVVGPLPDDTPPLTRRERQALQCLAEGLADKAIVARLGVGRTTVENYVARLRVKLGAETRPHLIALAARRGLLDP